MNRAIPLSELYQAWKELGDVPVDENDNLDEDYFIVSHDAQGNPRREHFVKGTPREDVWHWFEEQNPYFIVGERMQGIYRNEDGSLVNPDPEEAATEEEHICKCGHSSARHGEAIGHLISLRCTEPGCTCWEWEKPTYNFGETPREIIVAAVQLTGKHYPCDLRGADARVMCDVVNQGIDSYLEAITSSVFTGNEAYLECDISAADMPVILRRMQEMSDKLDEDAELLRSAILETLGIEEV